MIKNADTVTRRAAKKIPSIKKTNVSEEIVHNMLFFGYNLSACERKTIKNKIGKMFVAESDST